MEKVDLVDLYGIDLSVMNAFTFDTHHQMRFHNDLSYYTTRAKFAPSITTPLDISN